MLSLLHRNCGASLLRQGLVGATTIVVSASSIFAQNTLTVKGVVTDSRKEPLIGVNVRVQGTSIGAATDLNGKFNLTGIRPDATLEVSYVGMQTQLIKLQGRSELAITLQDEASVISDVVVVGYGKAKKGDLSAAVATLGDVEKLKARPITNAAEMLQGQIPGVTVVANGGHPDATPTITIRGMGSRSGESPLYVVDGVPGAPFNFSDVVSMTVLKDAASAAIYGAHAGSAGVILVTTKQAAAGKTSIELNSVIGFAQAGNLPQSLTIEEQRKVRAMALGGEDRLPSGWNPTLNPYIATTRTDWIDAIFRTAPFQRHNIALSGGTENFSNRLSVEYNNRQGTLISTYNKELTLRLNSSFSLGKHLRIREDLSWKSNDRRGTNTTSAESGVILSALMMPRNAEVYNADGSYGGTAPMDAEYIHKYGNNFSDIHGDVINPVRTLSAHNLENARNYLTSTTFLDIIEPIKGLNYTGRFTYKLGTYFQKSFSPRRLEPGKPDKRNSLAYINQRSTSWDFENTINYERLIKRHSIGLMLSTTASEYKYRDLDVVARELTSEAPAMQYLPQATDYNTPEDSYLFDRNLSFVGRVSYSWADRYFATASLRRDYAGRLAEGYKYGDFPSVTLAWKLTSEKFFPKNDVLNLLKLRASWGRIGNLGSIGMGYAYPLLAKLGGEDVGSMIGAESPITIGRYVANGFNPRLTWETSEQLDLGLDLALFKNRLNLTFDYFFKRTKDLIKTQDYGWSNSIGISPMLINEGEVHNKGIEISASWNDKIGKVNYWINANMATLKNLVYNIGSADDKGNKPVWTDGGRFKDLEPYRTEEGQPLYSYWLLQTNGVFANADELAAHVGADGKPIQPKAQIGDLRFVDQDGDGKINSNDRIFMGNAMPKLTYSISVGASWQNWSLSAMLQGVGGVKLFNAYKYTTLNEAHGSFNRSRQILEALNGGTASTPRISASDLNGNFTSNSDFYLERGDYLRLKNLSLSYTLKKPFKFVESINLSLSAENLLTLTKYTGIDPEVGGIGLDAGQYPVSRMYSLGVSVKF